MYQIEVKAILVESLFNPKDGWTVIVDLDAMEMAKGGTHPEGKAEVAAKAKQRLEKLGARIGADEEFGRADLVARHASQGTYVVEVEGDTSRQREQAMYSTLGQILLMIEGPSPATHYAIALPDHPKWEHQASKIPAYVQEQLQLEVLLASEGGVRRFPGRAE
ncbi:MAG: hypothetical protein IIA89_09850 [Chloroflexi bacterium]|nr:hypothetical protein [Chloroflexota bacterium]